MTYVPPLTQLGPSVFAVAPGTDLTPILQQLAGTNARIILPGNNFARPCTINFAALPAGTFAGGLKLEGPCRPPEKTYTGNPGAAAQLTLAQLAGNAACVQVLSGSTANFSLGVSGIGVDGLQAKWVFFFAPTLSSAQAFIDDTSATVEFEECGFADFTGSLVKFCLKYTEIRCTYAQSSANPACLMAVFGAINFLSRDSVHDYFNQNHFYVGGNGPLAQFTGQYGIYDVDGTQFNPSGLYTMDVALDLEFGPTLGLREFRFGRIFTTNTKPFYATNVGRISGYKITHRITRSYGTAPGNLPAAGCPIISSAGSSGVTSGPIDLDIGVLEIVQEANSSPLAFPPHVLGLANYTYLGKWRIGLIRMILNGPSFATQQTGNVPAILRFSDPAPGVGVTQLFSDELVIDAIEIGFNRAIDSTGKTVPAGKAIPLFSAHAGSGSGTTVFGRVRIGHVRCMKSSGPNAVAWVPTSGVAFTVATEGTYEVLGGTVSAIAINGSATGLTAGAWHLQPGDQITVTWTVLPTFNLYTGNGEPLVSGDGVNALLSALVNFGAAAVTVTVADEELGLMDAGGMAAAAVTRMRTTAGTLTTTRRTCLATAPADAADTYTVGASPLTITHGTTALVTKTLAADGPGTITVVGGTISSITVNGSQVASAASASGIQIDVEIGDVIVITYTGAPTAIRFAGDRRLGA